MTGGREPGCEQKREEPFGKCSIVMLPGAIEQSKPQSTVIVIVSWKTSSLPFLSWDKYSSVLQLLYLYFSLWDASVFLINLLMTSSKVFLTNHMPSQYHFLSHCFFLNIGFAGSLLFPRIISDFSHHGHSQFLSPLTGIHSSSIIGPSKL